MREIGLTLREKQQQYRERQLLDKNGQQDRDIKNRDRQKHRDGQLDRNGQKHTVGHIRRQYGRQPKRYERKKDVLLFFPFLKL